MSKLVSAVVLSVWPLWLLVAVCMLVASMCWWMTAIDPMYAQSAARLKQGEQAKSEWLDQRQQYLDSHDGK